MVPSLLVAALVTAPGAPVPKDTDPNTAGPAPRIAAVKADGTGTVWISAQVYERRKVPQQYIVIENGKQVLKQREVEQTLSNHIRKPVSDFGGKFTTADGVPLSAEEATRRLKGGATLLITADGKPIGKGWLRSVRDDAVVMVAEGLAHAHFQYGAESLPTTAAPRMVKLCADDQGAVSVAVNPRGDQQAMGQVYYDEFGGGAPINVRARVVAINGPGVSPQEASESKKPLGDVKFDAFDINGGLIPRSDALKRLKAGGLVLLASDNRFPDAAYLKAFRGDVLVLVAGEFVFPQGIPNPYDLPTAAMKMGEPAPVAPVQLPAVQLVRPQAVQLKAVQQAAAANEAAAKEKLEKEAAAKEAKAKAAAEKAKPVAPIKP